MPSACRFDPGIGRSGRVGGELLGYLPWSGRAWIGGVDYGRRAVHGKYGQGDQGHLLAALTWALVAHRRDCQADRPYLGVVTHDIAMAWVSLAGRAWTLPAGWAWIGGVAYRRGAFTAKPRRRGQCLLPGGSARALATQSHSYWPCLFCLGATRLRASVRGGQLETRAYYRSMGEARPMPSACRFDQGIGRAGDSARRSPSDAAELVVPVAEEPSAGGAAGLSGRGRKGVGIAGRLGVGWGRGIGIRRVSGRLGARRAPPSAWRLCAGGDRWQGDGACRAAVGPRARSGRKAQLQIAPCLHY